MARTKKETTEKVEVKDDKKELKKELLDYINKDLKKDLDIYIESEVKKEFADILEKRHKKEIRSKVRKIVFRDIIIVLLLVVIGYLCFVIYEDKDIKGFLNIKNNDQTEKKKEKVEDLPPTLDELKDKYGSYIDNYFLPENSTYLEDLYNKNYNEQLKLSLVMNNIDFSDFDTEDDYYVIDEELLEKKYKEMFNEEFKPISFEYNGNKIRYFNRLSSFVTDSIFDKASSNIVREIIDIKDNKDTISITTVEGLVLDNVLYNPKTKEVITEEYNGNILDYQDSLETVTYVFKNNKLLRVE